MLQEAAATLLPGTRTSKCHRWKIGAKPEHQVSVFRSKQNGATFFGGLQTCGSVWSCPLCAAKISERRRIDLKEMMVGWKARGGRVYMMTQTFRHGPYDQLPDLLRKFRSACSKFFNRKVWRAWVKAVGLWHWIKVLEVTHGANGWHVHMHMLLFVKPMLETKEPRSEDLFSSWQSVCVSVGLGKPSREHGLVITDGAGAADYVSKWGLDLEMTKAHVKRGREGHRTPWDLLRDFEQTGDCQSGALFKEFGSTFKGKRQLVCSRGMRADLGVEPEKTDQEIVQEQEENATLLGSFSDTEWVLILRHRARGHVLEIARHGDWSDVQLFVSHLSFSYG
jgi:hypothetical protein